MNARLPGGIAGHFAKPAKGCCCLSPCRPRVERDAPPDFLTPGVSCGNPERPPAVIENRMPTPGGPAAAQRPAQRLLRLPRTNPTTTALHRPQQDHTASHELVALCCPRGSAATRPAAAQSPLSGSSASARTDHDRPPTLKHPGQHPASARGDDAGNLCGSCMVACMGVSGSDRNISRYFNRLAAH